MYDLFAMLRVQILLKQLLYQSICWYFVWFWEVSRTRTTNITWLPRPNVGAEPGQQKYNGKALFNINFNNLTYLYTISVTNDAIASFAICNSTIPYLLPFAEIQIAHITYTLIMWCNEIFVIGLLGSPYNFFLRSNQKGETPKTWIFPCLFTKVKYL